VLYVILKVCLYFMYATGWECTISVDPVQDTVCWGVGVGGGWEGVHVCVSVYMCASVSACMCVCLRVSV
jgi:hypothetical protein